MHIFDTVIVNYNGDKQQYFFLEPIGPECSLVYLLKPGAGVEQPVHSFLGGHTCFENMEFGRPR